MLQSEMVRTDKVSRSTVIVMQESEGYSIGLEFSSRFLLDFDQVLFSSNTTKFVNQPFCLE